MITSADVPQITDFGLSHNIDAVESIDLTSHGDNINGSLRWLSRELLFPDDPDTLPRRTKESDIWAFGMTCLVIY